MAINLSQPNWYCENCGALLHKKHIKKGYCWKCGEKIKVTAKENLERTEQEVEDFAEDNDERKPEVYCWRCGGKIEAVADSDLVPLEQASDDHEGVCGDALLKGYCQNCGETTEIIAGEAIVLPGQDVEDYTEVPAEMPFVFTGNAGEYFKIWIVNVCLTVLTLGIYSAWAKVRKKRYFYGNTLLQNVPFEYLADPAKILKGRLIVLVFFVVYMTASYFSPVLTILLMLFYLVIFPWVFIRAMAFKTRNSSYRNIRLDFQSTYGEALGFFIGLGILTGITFGLAYPYFVHQRRAFIIEHSSYGITKFDFPSTVGSFYGAYLKAIGIGVGSGFLVFLVGSAFETITLIVTPFLFWIAYLLVVIYLRTSIANLAWSNTKLGSGSSSFRFVSTLRYPRMLALYISNAIAIVVSLGLLVPWATVRMLRYRLENFKVLAAGDLDGFIAGEQQKVSAAGEEIGEFFDFDFGL